jgi:hypothetical protein
MKRNTEDPGKILDHAIDSVRQASVSPEEMSQASARVLQRMREEYNKVVPHPSSDASIVDRIQSCDDFRSLIPAYLTSSLTPARRLLFEDHIRECVGCRKALETARRGASRATIGRISAVRRIQPKHLKWALPIAAMLVVAVAVQTGPVRDLLWPIDVHATVQLVDGGLFNISGQDVRSVKAGQRIERGQALRTGAASGAMLELADGSRIEMAARSELSLGRARDGVKVQLARGNVIVKAAKQHGHLYVETSDCTVSVVGTAFSVSSGIKGSRVVVIEGKVRVMQEGKEQFVEPGQQIFTSPEMGEVSIEQAIGWSREAEEWFKELTAFGQDMAKRLEGQSMRYTSNLLPLVPADTLVFASLPNVAQPFRESYQLFTQRVGENAALSNWWRQAQQPQSGMNLNEVADRIAEVGAYLGAEVVLAVPKQTTGRGPVILAETARPDSLISALEGDLRRLAEVSAVTVPFRLAHSKEELGLMSGNGPVIYVADGLMIVSDPGSVARTVAIHEGRVAGGFAGTPLHSRVAQAYQEGVGWLLAVDLQQIIPQQGDDVAPRLGFDNVRQLVLEQKTGIGSAASRVTLAFNQDRHGMAAWLGAPAPMGALDFVSPDAYGFSSWVTKDAELILDDIFGMIQDSPEATQHLRDIEQKHGIDLRRDLAEPLGNEVLVAIDGPLLPTPSWKVVLEVNDMPRLENAIQYAVTNVNRELLLQQKPEWSLGSETVDGKTYHSLTSKGSPMEIHYTSWMGYMLLAPSRALLMEAIRIHDTGSSIARSTAFRAEMPSDGRDISSGIMYQNVESLSRAIPSVVTDPLSGAMQNELRQAAVLQKSFPKVAVVYGEPDRILGSAKGSFGINIASMLGFQGIVHAAGFGNPHSTN